MKKIKWGLLLTAAVACLLLMAGCGEKGSTGLEYTLAEDGNSWYVAGMGSCTDIVIPSKHEGSR